MTYLDGHASAEQAVLCALGIFEDAPDEILATLQPEDFPTPAARKTFELAQAIAADDVPVTIDELMLRCREVDGKEAMELGLLPFVAGLDIHMPSKDGWRRQMSLLRDARQLAELHGAAAQWADTKTPASMSEIRDEMAEVLEGFRTTSLQRRAEKAWADVVAEALEEPDPARASGFRGLDNLLNGGFRDGELVVVGGSTSMGKSAFAQNVARLMARDGVPVMYFSLEMTSRENVLRLLSMESGVEFRRLQNREYLRSRQDVELVRHAQETVTSYPLEIIDQGVVRPADVVQRVVTAKREPWLVIVDYLTLLSPDRQTGQRYLDVGEMARVFKVLAQDRQICVMALAQLNREASKTIRRPRLADLKESGDIENHSNTVLAPWRPGKLQEEQEQEGPCDPDELLVLKNRNGMLGDVPMHFDGPTLTWREMDYAGDRYAQAG